MKQLDKLILKSFTGPFALTFVSVVFILLNRQLLFYYDDIIGKGLEWTILGQLISYFAIFILPQALPLAILLASLITFGNLAEHFELTAIKASGISLLRVLAPIAVVVGFLTLAAFVINNHLVPNVALKAYSLLYDIKQKKPTLELKEGVFYNGLPKISIKVNKKFADDDAALKDVILYDHKNPGKGYEVWRADSGRMQTIHNGQFLKFELYNGFRYQQGVISNESLEEAAHDTVSNHLLSRTAFDKSEFVIDLSSFDMLRTDPALFGNNRMMKNRSELKTAIDSLQRKIEHQKSSIANVFSDQHQEKSALEHARQKRQQLLDSNERIQQHQTEKTTFEVQRHRILTNSMACFIMFLIGAPLGSIIRKGGLGLPVLLSIAFFLIYFVIDIQAEELAQSGTLPVAVCMWIANAVLFICGVYFLVSARNDSRLFEADYHHNLFVRVSRLVNLSKHSVLNSF